MSSGSSARLFHHPDIHSHGDAPQCDPRRPGFPSGEEEGAVAPAWPETRLWREDGRLLCDCGNGERLAVRLLWARPLSGRGGPVSVMLAGKKREVRYIESLDMLDPESRRIAVEELDHGMVLPRIERIVSVMPRFGNYYWNVLTNRGPRTFLLASPENSAVRPSPDSIVLKDVGGNVFEINPVSGLDAHSLREFDKVY